MLAWPARRDVHPAVAASRSVVGLYGDPDITWSVILDVDLTSPLDQAELEARLSVVVVRYPHLGLVPAVRRFGAESVDAVRTEFASAPYGDFDPLLRVGLATNGRGLMLGAHHGAIDGLGLLGLTGLLIDRPLGSSARGLRRSGPEPSFALRSAQRLVEALLHPPERIMGTPRDDTGDWLKAAEVPPRNLGTSAAVWAAARLLTRWNGPTAARRHRVVAVGISRRPGAPPVAPDRDTAYSRLDITQVRTREEASSLLRGTPPEPDFPARDAAGLAPRMTRLLSGRLGASVLVSNLGVVSGGVSRCLFWPTASGPNGVALGLASTGQSGWVTIRARRGWFTEDDADQMLEIAAHELTRIGQ